VAAVLLLWNSQVLAMRYRLSLCVVLAVVGCLTDRLAASEEVYFRASPGKKVHIGGGGNGTTYRKAILVHVPSGANPVGPEYDYVMARFPGCKVVRHQREFYTTRTYDIITFTSSDGASCALFFEVALEH
jgi:hypothetical protein